jgi:predicted PurR-regulated permease PerM
MNLKNMLWLAAIIFAIAAIVDFFDNNILKLVGTACLAVAFAMLASAQNNPRKKMLTSLSYLFLCAAIGVFVYRLLNYYQG